MLHIANIIRDQKFIDGQIAYHDLTSDKCQHDYFIVSWEKNIVFKYMKKSERVRIVTPDELIDILEKYTYDALFIHNFLYMPLHYMWKIPASIKVFWFAWGYDIYNTPKDHPYISIPLLHNKSQALLEELRRTQNKVSDFTKFKREIKAYIKKIVQYKRQDHNDEPSVYKKAVTRVDYFSGVFPLEYNLLKEHPEFHAKRVVYEYTNPADWENIDTEIPEIGHNVLIGNSADINNNHLDVLDYLKGVNFSGKKVIVPLSYGGSKHYANTIAQAYDHFFGNVCISLLDYMPREDYFKLLSSVGVGIFFHERQQATCNIEELLRHGVKLFLSETSINYKHYKSVGYHIYSLQHDFNQHTLETPLTDEQKLHNAKLWLKTSNKEYRLKYLYDIYDLLNNQKQ